MPNHRGAGPLSNRRFEIGAVAALLLVLLRLVIGLHFFSEGAKHHADPQWSSEGFIRAAKGPLAPLYQSVLTDYHLWDNLFYPEAAEKRSTPGKAEEAIRSIAEDWETVSSERAKKFVDRIVADWDKLRGQMAAFYGYTEEQTKAAAIVLARRQAELELWFEEHAADLAEHVHNWRRASTAAASPSAADVPFQKSRIAAKQAVVRGQANAWIAEIKKIESGYEQDLRRLRTDQQQAKGELPTPASTLRNVDTLMTYWVWIVGGLLLIGLVTRLAAFAGALFLLSVILSQPFWLAESQPTINQSVEMFALLALAALPTGRWGGLDYFLHQLFSRRVAAGGQRA